MLHRPSRGCEGTFTDDIQLQKLTLSSALRSARDRGRRRVRSIPEQHLDAGTDGGFGGSLAIWESVQLTSIYGRNPFENRRLVVVMLAATALSIGMLYVPFGQSLLGAEAVQLKHLVMCLAIASLPTFALSGIRDLFGVKWL